MSVQGATKNGTVAVGATMFGQTSGACCWMLNDQIAGDKIYFKYQPGYGSVGLGTTGFTDGEIVWFGVDADSAWCRFYHDVGCNILHQWSEGYNP